MAEIFRTLKERLRDTTWTICFKALIIVHLMIKEGERDATLKYLAAAPKNRLAINSYTDGMSPLPTISYVSSDRPKQSRHKGRTFDDTPTISSSAQSPSPTRTSITSVTLAA